MDPEDMGGTPAVMPTNSWWDLATQGIQSAEDIALARISGTRSSTGGAQASAPTNLPPGGGGVNPAAASVPGGIAASTRNAVTAITGSVTSVLPLIVIALVGAFVWKKFVR